MSKIGDVKALPTVRDNKLEIGGKLRKLQFDLNAMGELENMYGTIATAMEALQGGKMADIKKLLWAGLIHEEAELDEVTGEPIKYNITPYQVGGWINMALLQRLGPIIGNAMTDGMPRPQDMTPAQRKQFEDSAAAAGLEITPEGQFIAKVELTPEEEAEQKAEEAKNA